MCCLPSFWAQSCYEVERGLQPEIFNLTNLAALSIDEERKSLYKFAGSNLAVQTAQICNIFRYSIFAINGHRRTSRGGGGGGEGGCSPPVTIFLKKVSGKTLMIRAKVLGRKYSKRLSKPEGYFPWRLPCQDGVKVKWSKDPGICFGKAIYRLYVYRRNPRDEY